MSFGGLKFKETVVPENKSERSINEIVSLVASEVLPMIWEIQATVNTILVLSDPSIKLSVPNATGDEVSLHDFLHKLLVNTTQLENEIKKVRDEGEDYRIGN
jgi:hypothetical protein